MKRQQRQLLVLFCAVGKTPERMTIADDLRVFQKLVGGHIELLGLFDNVYLVCNEEGKLQGLPVNRIVSNGLHNEVIVGDFFVVGSVAPEFVSLTEAQIERTLMLLGA